jgi:hypothetical protein
LRRDKVKLCRWEALVHAALNNVPQ